MTKKELFATIKSIANTCLKGVVRVEELFVAFYKPSEEEEFLAEWQQQNYQLEEEAIDELFAQIAEKIDQAIRAGRHELGQDFYYHGTYVGQSDYNEFHQLYMFSRS